MLISGRKGAMRNDPGEMGVSLGRSENAIVSKYSMADCHSLYIHEGIGEKIIEGALAK
jgi:hypothetical protein